jgi:hypothetical protein
MAGWPVVGIKSQGPKAHCQRKGILLNCGSKGIILAEFPVSGDRAQFAIFLMVMCVVILGVLLIFQHV